MTSLRNVVNSVFIATLCALSLLTFSNVKAQDGKTLFMANCAACHAVDKQVVGPALAGVTTRWPDKNKLHAWIRNNQAFLKTGDAYANKLFLEYHKMPMLLFPDMKDAEIDAIISYINTAATATKEDVHTAVGVHTAPVAGSSGWLNFIVAITLLIIIFILWRTRKRLSKIADEQQDIARMPLVWWKNKMNITVLSIILAVLVGYFVVKGATGLGNSQSYQPVQPIFFSHKVHAGVNQINCLYCHVGAQYSKQSTIPSVNICMNCHKAINSYSAKSEKIYREDGTEVDANAEIKKLYGYAGFEPGQLWDASKAKPIEWVRIHTLPDFVYFNHSQHVNVGQVACQTCHGEIQGMSEVKQFAPLTMGWCVNCHRTTKVNFDGNAFYSMYEKYHKDIKSGEMDSVTVEAIGGTECQKCHY